MAEHLPESVANKFVDLVCTLSDTIVLTAAIPGQGGTDHVNEQPNEDWIEKLAHRGMQYEAEETMRGGMGEGGSRGMLRKKRADLLVREVSVNRTRPINAPGC